MTPSGSVSRALFAFEYRDVEELGRTEDRVP
jgi:hypothetical protein